MVNDSFHHQKEHAGLEFMTFINLLLSNTFSRKDCQGVSPWSVCYPLVNWTVFSVWEILYFDIAHELLIVNIKYNKSQNINIMYHYLILKIHVTNTDKYGMFL